MLRQHERNKSKDRNMMKRIIKEHPKSSHEKETAIEMIAELPQQKTLTEFV